MSDVKIFIFTDLLDSSADLTMSLLARNLSKLVSTTSRRGLAVTSSLKADLSMPDPLEHATGKTGLHFFIIKISLLSDLIRSGEIRAAGQAGR